ncbi:MAG TPA: sulfotransferase, partial [Candidatus Dormibacteraeota bacterium]
MTLPNFLIIGAAKSGTDSLYGMLGQHPQIYISPSKEPMFFVAEGLPEVPYRGPSDREVLLRWDSWVNTLEHYESLFGGATVEKAIGEASTWYLYDEGAPHRIKHHVPDAKLIAVLRNPVERAYSAFTMMLR